MTSLLRERFESQQVLTELTEYANANNSNVFMNLLLTRDFGGIVNNTRTIKTILLPSNQAIEPYYSKIDTITMNNIILNHLSFNIMIDDKPPIFTSISNVMLGSSPEDFINTVQSYNGKMFGKFTQVILINRMIITQDQLNDLAQATKTNLGEFATIDKNVFTLMVKNGLKGNALVAFCGQNTGIRDKYCLAENNIIQQLLRNDYNLDVAADQALKYYAKIHSRETFQLMTRRRDDPIPVPFPTNLQFVKMFTLEERIFMLAANGKLYGYSQYNKDMLVGVTFPERIKSLFIIDVFVINDNGPYMVIVDVTGDFYDCKMNNYEPIVQFIDYDAASKMGLKLIQTVSNFSNVITATASDGNVYLRVSDSIKTMFSQNNLGKWLLISDDALSYLGTVMRSDNRYVSFFNEYPTTLRILYNQIRDDIDDSIAEIAAVDLYEFIEDVDFTITRDTVAFTPLNAILIGYNGTILNTFGDWGYTNLQSFDIYPKDLNVVPVLKKIRKIKFGQDVLRIAEYEDGIMLTFGDNGSSSIVDDHMRNVYYMAKHSVDPMGLLNVSLYLMKQ